MSNDPSSFVGEVVGPAGAAITQANGFAALNHLVSAARECHVVHQQESSKRAALAAYENTEIAKIKVAESVLKQYFAQVFAERRSNFEELFTRLDNALDAGDGESVNLMVRGIVDIAKSSPLADLGDLGKIRAALDDPNQVWEF